MMSIQDREFLKGPEGGPASQLEVLTGKRKSVRVGWTPPPREWGWVPFHF